MAYKIIIEFKDLFKFLNVRMSNSVSLLNLKKISFQRVKRLGIIIKHKEVHEWKIIRNDCRSLATIELKLWTRFMHDDFESYRVSKLSFIFSRMFLKTLFYANALDIVFLARAQYLNHSPQTLLFRGPASVRSNRIL